MLNLKPIKDRLDATTPGRWYREVTGVAHGGIRTEKAWLFADDGATEADAEMVARSKEDLTSLVAEVGRLREENDLLRRRLHKEKEARERALGYDELTDDQKREILAINVAQLDWPT